MLGNLRLIEATKIWSLETASPKLWKRFTQDHLDVSDLVTNELKGHFPIAPTSEPFDEVNCARPAKHNRAFYIKHPRGSVIAVKGSEAADDRLADTLRSLIRYSEAGWSATEVFPLREQRLPFAVLVSEAMQEATKTIQFMEKYLDHFDELPMFPLHLSIYRMPDSTQSGYFSKLYNFTSERSRQQCELHRQDGLAVYTYYFPALPVRLGHIVPTGMLKNGIVDSVSRDRILSERYGFDTRVAIETFLTLAGKMLALGFFPLSLDSFGSGYCTSAQNVTIHGGMVDSESIIPFDQTKSDWEFYTIFLTTLGTLCATARVMLYSPLQCVRFEFKDPSPISMLLSDLVWGRIREEVARCAQLGLKVDPRLEELLSPPSYDKAHGSIGKMYPRRPDWHLSRHLTDCEENRGWD